MIRNRDFIIFLLYAAILNLSKACTNIEVVPRSEWGGRAPVPYNSLKLPLEHVIIAHTVTGRCYTKAECASIMRSIQTYHMSKLNFPDIGYNFVVGGDGRVYEGAGWTTEGAHTYRWNSKSYGIAFIGDYRYDKPKDAMVEAARSLIICGIKKGYISKTREIHGARDAICTESPGNELYDIIKKWPRFKGGPLPGYTC